MKKNILKNTVRILRPFRTAFFVIFLFAMIMEGIGVVAPYFFGKIIDAVLISKSLEEALFFVALSGVALILEIIVGQIKNIYELRRFDYLVNRHLSIEGLSKTLSFSLGQHKNEHSGIKQSVLSRGAHSLQSAAYAISYDIFPTLLSTTFAMIAIIVIQPTVGIIGFIGTGIYVAWTIWMNNRFHGDITKMQKMWNENSRLESEIVRNVEVIKVNAREKKVITELGKQWMGIVRHGRKMWTHFSYLDSFRNATSVLIRLAGMAIAVLLVFNGLLEAGALVMLFFWFSSVFGGLRHLGRTHRGLLEDYAAIRKFFIMFNVPPDITGESDAKRPEISGAIEFRNVSFTYPKQQFLSDEDADNEDIEKRERGEEREVLSNVNFLITPGERVALVGESGAGKSTTSSLMLRAYDPTRGDIFIDGINLKDIDLSYYREHIGHVEQDVSLFDNTLGYNLTFSINENREKISDDELQRISEIARIDKFLARLPDRYETVIGERGVRLSGGERQRVGIARALIKDPKILIFDEATSNLDTTNEKEIREAIRKASEGRTTIIIAHRFSTIKDADRIVVFNEGTVAGIGTHEDLMKNCSAYKRLVKDQVFV